MIAEPEVPVFKDESISYKIRNYKYQYKRYILY